MEHDHNLPHASPASDSSSLLQTLISRDYRGDVDRNVINHFLPMLLNAEEEGTVSPILVHEKATFIYIKHNNLYCIPPLPTPSLSPLSPLPPPFPTPSLSPPSTPVLTLLNSLHQWWPLPSEMPTWPSYSSSCTD